MVMIIEGPFMLITAIAEDESGAAPENWAGDFGIAVEAPGRPWSDDFSTPRPAFVVLYKVTPAYDAPYTSYQSGTVRPRFPLDAAPGLYKAVNRVDGLVPAGSPPWSADTLLTGTWTGTIRGNRAFLEPEGSNTLTYPDVKRGWSLGHAVGYWNSEAIVLKELSVTPAAREDGPPGASRHVAPLAVQHLYDGPALHVTFLPGTVSPGEKVTVSMYSFAPPGLNYTGPGWKYTETYPGPEGRQAVLELADAGLAERAPVSFDIFGQKTTWIPEIEEGHGWGANGPLDRQQDLLWLAPLGEWPRQKMAYVTASVHSAYSFTGNTSLTLRLAVNGGSPLCLDTAPDMAVWGTFSDATSGGDGRGWKDIGPDSVTATLVLIGNVVLFTVTSIYSYTGEPFVEVLQVDFSKALAARTVSYRREARWSDIGLDKRLDGKWEPDPDRPGEARAYRLVSAMTVTATGHVEAAPLTPNP